MVQAEALLKSIPLTVVSSDEKYLRPLTPYHFMVGHVNLSTAMEVVPERKVHPYHRWCLVQDLICEVWRRWLKEIAPRLNVTTKWCRCSPGNVAIGDIFLVIENSSPRGKWPMGRVMSMFLGRDGIVRMCEVKVNGKRKRAVRRLIPLDVEPLNLDGLEQQSLVAVSLDTLM